MGSITYDRIYSSVTNMSFQLRSIMGNCTLRCLDVDHGTGGTAYLVVSVGYNYSVSINKPEKQLQSHKMRPETWPILSSRMSC